VHRAGDPHYAGASFCARATDSQLLQSTRDFRASGSSLWFSERPELCFTSIELADSAGTVIPHGPVTSIDSMGVSAD
jgi:hypothetical protein